MESKSHALIWAAKTVLMIVCAVLMLGIGLTPAPAKAQDKLDVKKGATCNKPCRVAKANTQDVPNPTQEEPEGRNEETFASVLKVLKNVAQAPYLGVTVNSSYEVLQNDGVMVEFNEQRQYNIARPDRGRVEVSRADGSQTTIYYNGKTLVAHKPNDRVYAEIEAPASVDDTIIYLVKDMKINVPIARLFLTSLPEDIDQIIKEAHYVGTSRIQGQATDHFVLRGEDVDVQMWATKGEKPLPLRIVINYKLAPGEPNFRADFADWALAPPENPVNFEFTPADNEEKVPFVVPKTQVAGATTGTRRIQ